MKKLILVSTAFMMSACISAMERDIVQTTRSTISYKKINQKEKITSPLIIGNKQFGSADLKNLSDSQKNILLNISNPHCCLVPYGVDSVTVRECDIKDLKKMPADITKDLGVYVVKEKTDIADCCLRTTGGFSCILLTVGEVISLASCVSDSRNAAIWTPATKATAGLGFGGIVCLLAFGVIRFVHPCVCRDKEWYEFEISDDSNAEQNNWSDSQEQEDGLSD